MLWYYADRYPEEISAIIGLDESKPNQEKDDDLLSCGIGWHLKHLLDKTGNFLGICRIKNYFGENYVKELPFRGDDLNFYDQNLLDLMCKDFVWHNNSVPKVNERSMVYKNASELFDIKYHNNLPVLSILCQENTELKVVDWVKLHTEVISNPEIQKIEIIKGWHYIHHSQFRAIAKLVDSFLDNVNVS